MQEIIESATKKRTAEVVECHIPEARVETVVPEYEVAGLFLQVSAHVQIKPKAEHQESKQT